MKDIDKLIDSIENYKFSSFLNEIGYRFEGDPSELWYDVIFAPFSKSYSEWVWDNKDTVEISKKGITLLRDTVGYFSVKPNRMFYCYKKGILESIEDINKRGLYVNDYYTLQDVFNLIITDSSIKDALIHTLNNKTNAPDLFTKKREIRSGTRKVGTCLIRSRPSLATVSIRLSGD